MPILLDTGVLVAAVNSRDSLHLHAKGLLRAALEGQHGEPLSTDWVLGEGLTFLRSKVRDPAVAVAYSGLFRGLRDRFRGPLRLLQTGPDTIEIAEETFHGRFERGLSFTDCVLIVQAERLGASVATFDRGFEGIVPVVAE